MNCFVFCESHKRDQNNDSLASAHWGIMSAYLVLSAINALTEGFSIMLLVPLLDSLSADSLFSGIPILGAIGPILSKMDDVERLRTIAGVIFVIVVLRGTVQYLVDVIVYIMPLRVERDLRMRAFNTLMTSTISFAESFSAGDIGNYTASFPARVGIALRFLVQFFAALFSIAILLVLLLAITPSAIVAIGVFGVIASVLFRAITGPMAKRLDVEMADSQRDFTQAYFEAVNNKRTIRVFNATGSFFSRIVSLLERLSKIQVQTIAVQNSTYPFFSVLAGVLACGAILTASWGRSA